MLAVDAIETAYGVSQVLFGVSFTVDAGQVVTLLGRNGMGKTTTIRSIMGIVLPKAGTIVFDGRAIHRRVRGVGRCRRGPMALRSDRRIGEPTNPNARRIDFTRYRS